MAQENFSRAEKRSFCRTNRLSVIFFVALVSVSAYGQIQFNASNTAVPHLNNRIYVDGVKYPISQAGVQQAFDDACAGTLGGAQAGTAVYLPPMEITLNNTSGQQFLITCPLNVIGAGPSQTWLVVGNASDPIPVFRIRPSREFIGWFEFQGMRITSRANHGGDALFLDNSLAQLNHLIVHDMEITHLAPSSWAVNMGSLSSATFFDGDIYENHFAHGINMNQSTTIDSWRIDHNNFNSESGGITPCISANVVQGASHITAFNNNGGCAGGFFVAHGTTQCKILYNQIEQPASSTEPNSAVIDLMGDAYTIDGCEIRGNNINQHEFASVGIRLGNTTHTTIEGNVIAVQPAGGIGILLTSAAHDTVIPFNSYRNLGGGSAAIHNPYHLSAYAARGPEGKAKAPTFSFLNHPQTGWYSAGGVLQSAVNGTNSLGILPQGVQVGTQQVVGWSSSPDVAGAPANSGLSSCGAACVAVGDGSPASPSGQIRAASAILGTAIIGGNLIVNGTIYKSAGGFKIDHPLDPKHKFLSHSFVESPDMKDIYDGVAILNGKGEAEITLPDYFQALNKDFRYQLTCIGGAAPVYVAREIENNHFLIAGGKAGLKVSWQVTGTRNDTYARQHRIAVEEDKPAAATASAQKTH